MVDKLQALNYTGPSLGNQVDGLLSARHTEAVWGPCGVFGPAPIGAKDCKNIIDFFSGKVKRANVLGISKNLM